MKYRVSDDGLSFTEYETILEKMQIPLADYVQIKIEVSESCISKVWVDINDPKMQLNGQIYGDIDGIDPTYSRWLVFVDGELVRNEPVEIGQFSISIPLVHIFLMTIQRLMLKLKHGLHGTPLAMRARLVLKSPIST